MSETSEGAATKDIIEDAEPKPGGYYEVVAAIGWLQSCRKSGIFEDWGCGFADPKGPWAKRFVKDMQYRGIDTNAANGVDLVADVRHRISPDADAVLLNETLTRSENWWQLVLDNALRSYKMRMVIIERDSGKQHDARSPMYVLPLIHVHAPSKVVRTSVPLDNGSFLTIYQIER